MDNLIVRGCLSINDQFTSSAMQSLSQQCLLIFMIARPLSVYTTNQEKHRNEARLCSYIIEMAKLLSYFFNWEFPLLIASTIELA